MCPKNGYQALVLIIIWHEIHNLCFYETKNIPRMNIYDKRMEVKDFVSSFLSMMLLTAWTEP